MVNGKVGLFQELKNMNALIIKEINLDYIRNGILGGKNIKNITYKIGKRIKEYEFIKDGNRFMEINKKNGFLDGRWVRWYATGLKEEEGDYSKGIRVGTWSRYDINGQIIEEESNYDNKGRNLYEITYYKMVQ